jgi:hypothetical protein
VKRPANRPSRQAAPKKKPVPFFSRWERVLAKALLSADAGLALRHAAHDRSLPASLRQALAKVDVDGARLAALLVARLRFERLLAGSDEAAEWFEREPQVFTRAFQRYHRDVEPTELFPPGEARLFTAWVRSSTSRR